MSEPTSTNRISIPPEIWIAVATTLQNRPRNDSDTANRQAIQNLSNVSQSHRASIQPLLFESLTIAIKGRSGVVPVSQRLHGIAALLDARPEANRWIKSLSVSATRPSQVGEDTTALLETVFVRMLNLRVVNMLHVHFTQGMYAHLYQLTNMEKFILEPYFPNNVAAIKSMAQLQVRDLGIRTLVLGSKRLHSSDAMEAFARLALSDRLEALFIGGQIFASSLWNLPNTVTLPSHAFSNLTSLITAPPGTPEHLDLFFNFVKLCPNITNLQFRSPYTDYRASSWEEQIITVETGDVLLRLTKLQAPQGLARLLVPGRPVTHLHVLDRGVAGDERVSGNLLRALSSSSAVIIRLHMGMVESSVKCLDDVAEYFPHLKSFQAGFEGRAPWLEDSFIEQVQRLPNLERLVLRHDVFSEPEESTAVLETQRKVLDGVKLAHVSLEEVSFEWDTIWRWERDNSWTWHKVDDGVGNEAYILGL